MTGEQWVAEADRRIDLMRKGEFSVRLTDAAGRPLAGMPVSIRLVRHRFRFGTAVAFGRKENEDERRYRQFVVEHFNTLVCENAMKWYAIEPERDEASFGEADRLLRFAEENGMGMRGHCLFWAKGKFNRPWVHALGPEELRRRVDEHVDRLVSRYRGRLHCWDVNNEMLDGSFFADRLGEEVRAHLFRRAHEADPGTPLFVNEYEVLNDDGKAGRYLELIDRLRGAGAPVGGIGVQEHAAEQFSPIASPPDGEHHPERGRRRLLRPWEAFARLDQLAAATGLPIHLTEISARSSDERARAEGLETLFRVGFSHPAVEAILLWGFWGKRHWLGADAALVDGDWRLTRAGEALRHLLQEEWTTRLEGRTDGGGRIGFRGFFGEYVVAVAGHERSARLHPDALAADVAIDG